MKKSEMKELIKKQDMFIVEQSNTLKTQNNTVIRYKGYIKDLEHQLSLASESSEKKDLEIEKLHMAIVSQKGSIPITKETNHELFCLDHQEANMNYTTGTRDCKLEKGIEEDSTTFSRKMTAEVFEFDKNSNIDDNKCVKSPYITHFIDGKEIRVKAKQKDLEEDSTFSVGDLVECVAPALGINIGDVKQIEFIGDVSLSGVKMKGVEFGGTTLSFDLFRDCFKLYELKKDVEEDSTTFSSRFMPNVKFILHCVNFKEIDIAGHCNNIVYVSTTEYGNIWIMSFYKESFDSCSLNLVSKYEAIPELVPEWMFYDKESDSLIKKTCSNQMCQGEFCDCSDSFLNDDEKFESLLSKHSFHSRKS